MLVPSGERNNRLPSVAVVTPLCRVNARRVRTSSSVERSRHSRHRHLLGAELTYRERMRGPHVAFVWTSSHRFHPRGKRLPLQCVGDTLTHRMGEVMRR